MRWIWALACVVVVAASARADSLVEHTTLEDNGAPAPDTVYFRSGIRLQSHWVWAGFTPSTSFPPNLPRYVWTEPAGGYETYINRDNGPSRSWDLTIPDLAPASGEGQVSGYANVGVDLGSVSGADTDVWTFDFGATVSALSAVNSDGDNSDAVFRSWTTFAFDTEAAAGADAQAVVSSITLDDLPTLGPYETLRLRLIGGDSGTVDLGAGDTGGTFDILGQSNYLLIFEYEIRVPYGIDPDFALTYSISTGLSGGDPGTDPVPEPASLLLTALGAAGLLAWRRRASRESRSTR